MHPLAHHATNIIVSEDPDGTVRVLSKGLGVGPNGRVGSVVYRDVVVRTSAGWRFAARTGRAAATSAQAHQPPSFSWICCQASSAVSRARPPASRAWRLAAVPSTTRFRMPWRMQAMRNRL